jgi:hypothetical protein
MPAPSASRHRAPRRLGICRFTLPFIDQTSHSLIRLLWRRWLRVVPRSGRCRGRRASLDRSHHRSLESESECPAGATGGFKLRRRATPRIRRDFGFPLYRKAGKTNGRGRRMLCKQPIRHSNARRQLSQRIREPRQTHGAAHMAAARGRRSVRSRRAGEGRSRLSSGAVREPCGRARGCDDAHRLVALNHIRDGSAPRTALSPHVWSGRVQTGAVAINR